MSRLIDKMVERTLDRHFRSPAFKRQVEDLAVDLIRKGPDAPLSRLGFILKIAVELLDCSRPTLRWSDAKTMAADVYWQFRRDNNMVVFGDPDFDWDGAAARLLAHEYQIECWEPA